MTLLVALVVETVGMTMLRNPIGIWEAVATTAMNITAARLEVAEARQLTMVPLARGATLVGLQEVAPPKVVGT